MKQGDRIRHIFHSIQAWRRRHCGEARVHRAYANYAEQQSITNKHSALEEYYEVRAKRIDPTQDWWGYAEMRQKQVEAREDAVYSAQKALALHTAYVRVANKWGMKA